MIDLFSGLGGWSAAFRDRGHEVFTVDINPKFRPDLERDILEVYPSDLPQSPTVILASPPCIEFSRDWMPWLPSSKPAMDLTTRTMDLIRELAPPYWAIENVRGAVKWFKPLMGLPIKRVGSRYLWGSFPIFDCPHFNGKALVPPGPDRAAIRAMIPYGLSLALCRSIEIDIAHNMQENE